MFELCRIRTCGKPVQQPTARPAWSRPRTQLCSEHHTEFLELALAWVRGQQEDWGAESWEERVARWCGEQEKRAIRQMKRQEAPDAE